MLNTKHYYKTKNNICTTNCIYVKGGIHVGSLMCQDCPHFLTKGTETVRGKTKEWLECTKRIPEYILCSAIWIIDKKQHNHQPKNVNTGIVITGRRHHNCFATITSMYSREHLITYDKTQGFITSKDRFVDRKEAYKIAKKCKQIINKVRGNTLTSEDLW